MADRVRVLLEGGPCDGKKTTARRADFGPVSVKCGGVTYEPTSRVTAGGRLVYTTKASQQQPGPQPAPTGTKKLQAHGSWHHLMRTAFVRAPKELRGAEHAREAIRGLRRRRGLK